MLSPVLRTDSVYYILLILKNMIYYIESRKHYNILLILQRKVIIMSKITLDIPEKSQKILDAMYQTMEGRLEASTAPSPISALPPALTA